MSDGRKSSAGPVGSGHISRSFALDALRGLIIVFMALDHANLLVAQKHPSSEMWGGAFPIYHDALAFLTRFVTHLSAPGFFFLMGAGMVLFARSRQGLGWTRGQVGRHFLARGAVLIALKFLLVNRAWELAPGGWGIPIYIGVLFALGGSMMVGSLLLWLKPAALLGLTVVLALGTELLVPDPSGWEPMGLLAHLLILPGRIVRPDGGLVLWSNYPILPWLKLVTLGMVFGKWLLEDEAEAFSRAWKIGLAFLAAFVVVRYMDGFGNIRPRMGDGWMDWLNTVKYPPSLAFTLLTMGINLVILWCLSRVREGTQRVFIPLVVYGRAPFFFYVLHIFLYAGLGHLFTPQGSSIPAMYPFWLLGLVIMYPLCLWYGQLKQRQQVRSVLRFL